MIIKDKTSEATERRKKRLGLSGDVYIYADHFIESLDSHKRLIPDSAAQTIEQAYEERVEYEKSLAEAMAALETEEGEDEIDG